MVDLCEWIINESNTILYSLFLVMFLFSSEDTHANFTPFLMNRRSIHFYRKKKSQGLGHDKEKNTKKKKKIPQTSKNSVWKS